VKPPQVVGSGRADARVDTPGALEVHDKGFRKTEATTHTAREMGSWPHLNRTRNI